MSTAKSSNRGRLREAAKPEFFCWLLLAVTALAFPSIVHPQSKSTTAALSGTVSDPSGARVAESDGEAHQSRKWNCPNRHHERDRGVLVCPPRARHLYARGQRSGIQDNPARQEIVLTAGDTVAENVTLTIGATEQVEVIATSGPLLQTQDANISTELESRQIEELPLNLRNVLSFATLDSAVNVAGRPAVVGGGWE